jgi:hypothetical protein
MATWKKILREDYAVGVTDGLLNLSSTIVTGSSGTITIELEDNRTTTTEGAGLESITLSAGSGISIGAGGSIGLTDSSFTVAAGANDSPISLGGTLTFAAGGNLSVAENNGTITYSYTAPAASSSFGIVAVSGQTSVEADQNNDTLTFVGANGVAITTTAGTDTVTFTGANNWGAITANSGVTVTPATSSDGLEILGGTAISTVGTDADTLTINHANVSNTTGTSGSGTIGTGGGTFTAVTGVTVNAQGHVTNVNTGTLTLSSMVPQVADDNTNTDFYLLLQAATGNLAAKIDSTTTAGPRYNPSTATLTVANLTVNGTTTNLDTTHLAVEDKTITIAAGAANAAAANGAAIHVGISNDGLSETNINLLPKVKWNSGSELSGWTIADYNAGSAVVDKHVSTMQFATTASAPTAVDRGDFRYDTTTDILYVCIGN